MQSLAENNGWIPPVIRTVATTSEGVQELMEAIRQCAKEKKPRQLSGRYVEAAAELRLDHLGIAVKSIAAARGFYEALGLTVTPGRNCGVRKSKDCDATAGEQQDRVTRGHRGGLHDREVSSQTRRGPAPCCGAYGWDRRIICPADFTGNQTGKRCSTRRCGRPPVFFCASGKYGRSFAGDRRRSWTFQGQRSNANSVDQYSRRRREHRIGRYSARPGNSLQWKFCREGLHPSGWFSRAAVVGDEWVEAERTGGNRRSAWAGIVYRGAGGSERGKRAERSRGCAVDRGFAPCLTGGCC